MQEKTPEIKKVVSPEIAVADVESWLRGKRVSESKRERPHIKEAIKELIEAVSYGDVVIDSENMTITYNLLWPILNEDKAPVLSSLVFKPRLRTSELKDRTSKIEAGDGIGRICAIAGALTGQATSMIEKLDTEDMSIVNAVAVFFL